MPVALKKSWPRGPGEVWLLLRVFRLLVKVRAEVRHENLNDLLAKYSPSDCESERNEGALERVRGFVDGLCARLPVLQDKRCLPRSVVLYHFARRYGFPVVLHCGVQKTSQDALDGHAWLSLDGETFLEPDGRVDGFVVTYSYPEG